MRFTFHYSLPVGMSILTAVNGKEIKSVDTGSGQKTEYEIDGQVARVRFKSFYELDCSNWFLKAVFYWLIGICGLFTPRYEKLFPKVDCVLEFNATGESASASVVFLRNVSNGKPMISVTPKNCEVNGDKDLVYEIDLQLQKRMKRVRFFSRFARLVSFAAAIIIGINLITR